MKRKSFIPELEINRKSPAYRRAKAAGFTFYEIRHVFDVVSGRYILRCDFKCVCGRMEIFQRAVNEEELKYLMRYSPLFKNGWDVAQECENFGSFSEKHLREDGFSEEAIREIRYIYDLEDEVKELRRMKRIMEASMWGVMKYE